MINFLLLFTPQVPNDRPEPSGVADEVRRWKMTDCSTKKLPTSVERVDAKEITNASRVVDDLRRTLFRHWGE